MMQSQVERSKRSQTLSLHLLIEVSELANETREDMVPYKTVNANFVFRCHGHMALAVFEDHISCAVLERFK